MKPRLETVALTCAFVLLAAAAIGVTPNRASDCTFTHPAKADQPAKQ